MRAILTIPAHKDIAPLIWKATLWPEELELKEKDEVVKELSQAGIEAGAVNRAITHAEKDVSGFLPYYNNGEKAGYATLSIDNENDLFTIEMKDGVYQGVIEYLVKKYTPPQQET